MSEDTFGERVFTLRKESGMSQYELAKRLEIHAKNIGKYEKDEYVPSAFIARDMAKAFGVTTDYLLFGADAGSKEGVIHIKDRKLAQWLQEVDALDEETRDVVISVLKLAIRSSKAKKMLNEN